MVDRTPGQIGYEAYGEDSGWKAFDGRPMPRWADLRPDIATRWEVAAKAIVKAFHNEVITKQAKAHVDLPPVGSVDE